jgi:hypothetical protein
MSGSAVQPPETRLNRVLVPLRVDTRVEGVLVVGTKKESNPLTLEDRQTWPTACELALRGVITPLTLVNGTKSSIH